MKSQGVNDYYNKEDAIYLRDSKTNYVSKRLDSDANTENWSDSEHFCGSEEENCASIILMNSENKECKVEALLSIWNTNHLGQLVKDREINFHYNELFKRSDNFKMKL